jgi:hypothetical protein
MLEATLVQDVRPGNLQILTVVQNARIVRREHINGTLVSPFVGNARKDIIKTLLVSQNVQIVFTESTPRQKER